MEKKLTLTKHALYRASQRGIKKKEIEATILNGKAIGWHDGARVYEYKNTIVVVEEFEKELKIITTYRPNRTLEERVIKIPDPYEWFKEDDKQVFLGQAYFLAEKGLTEDEIVDHLTECFHAICGEFGE